MSQNRLAEAASPYLLQHAENPVHWWPWTKAALAEAQRLDKPILLSVGYAACHWCHVMAHESFEDEDVAEVMNRLFVNIKVDREERPDVDQVAMAALHALGEHGGWPITLFMTPRGEPFWGGTYFPKEPAYGRPGLVQVLHAVDQAYRERRDAVAQNVAAIRQALSRAPASPGLPTAQGLDDAVARLQPYLDPVHGGTAGAPKFPNASLLELLWRAHIRSGETGPRDAVLTALTHMAQGGIYDHLGGGFARYSVDERWLVPHFEKMLYDNAQLLRLYAWAHGETNDPLYRQRIEETVEFLDRDMAAEGGAFAASLDADSEGEEGKFYVWTPEEIEAVLGEEAERFNRLYNITRAGNFEGKSIPNRLHALEWRGEEEEDFASLRRRLREARDMRVWPGLDDKVLADWNGLAILGLVAGGRMLARSDWIARARHAYDAVVSLLGEGDRLGHAARAGRRVFPGIATDYAAMIAAALSLHEATGERRFVEDAIRWERALQAHHTDPNGGYFTNADDGEALVVRPRSAVDEATPSANGLMAQNLARLHLVTGDIAYRTRADGLISAFWRQAEANPFGYASLLNGFDTLLTGVTAYTEGGADRRQLDRVLARSGHPALVSVHEKVGALGEVMAGTGETARALICRGTLCLPPIETPEGLREALAPGAGRHGFGRATI
jgi:uncharacterized protein YyaL (SSP411 family)